MNPIKRLRKELKLSQTELAEKIGVDQTSVSKWELEKSYPDMDSAKKLAVLFQTPIDIIMGREQDEFSKKIDYSRGLKLIIDEVVTNAKVTDVPTEFLYQLTSFALPKPYYNMLYLYRQDENLQELYRVWKNLTTNDKRELIGYANALSMKNIK